jgi:hypothetical protein
MLQSGLTILHFLRYPPVIKFNYIGRNSKYPTTIASRGCVARSSASNAPLAGRRTLPEILCNHKQIRRRRPSANQQDRATGHGCGGQKEMNERRI